MAIASLMRDYYQTFYGIHDHTKYDSNNPIPLIGFYPAEDYLEVSLLRKRIEEFRKAKVHQVFGINWLDFIQLPSEVCAAMLEEVNEDVKAENAALASVK